jgi:hypothetical protein
MPKGRKVEDGQTPVRQADILVGPAAGRIRSTMNKRTVHREQDLSADGSA